MHLPSLSMAGFVARAVGWGAALFGLLRHEWVQDHLLVPLAGFQQEVACTLLRAPREGVVVDPSCTGYDAMALCVAVTLAYPAPWRRRLSGCAVGLALIFAVNTVRIATLSAVVGNRELFERLHLYIWPAVLIVVAAAYLFAWMNRVAVSGDTARAADSTSDRKKVGPALRFLGLTLGLVTVYYLFLEVLFESRLTLAVAHGAASVAGTIMSALGVEAQVSEGFLRTAGGAFLVTPECVLTPVIPVYLAAVLVAPLTVGRRVLAVLATVPLFLVLGTARLLVLALPASVVGTETQGVHAFYQMLAALIVVFFVAHRSRAPLVSRTLTAVTAGAASAVSVGLVDVWLVRPWLASTGAALHLGHGWIDAQGALAILPGYQVGLLVALVVATGRGGLVSRLLPASLLLLASQIVVVVGAGEMVTHTAIELPIVLIRLWALGLPLALFWAMTRSMGDPTALDGERAEYAGFWNDVGDSFPDLGGAASTDYYRENEQWLFETFLQPLDGLRVFKTDLWDEAKNTRILRWAAGRGVQAYGADISLPTTGDAIAQFEAKHLEVGGAAGDVRAVPFRDGAFDAVYSMGTIEHFAETEQAVGEIFRVTAPGGRAIIGVPNRFDPFLRPVMVWFLYRLGLYDYGLEKCYSRRELRGMCERAGFEVVAETGILFIPGWLRMLDLACWVWARPLSKLTALAVRPFAWLYRTFPRLRRHGYLIAAVVTRPSATSPGGSSSISRHDSEPST